MKSLAKNLLTNLIYFDIILEQILTALFPGVAQLVGREFRVLEVARSNRVTRTKKQSL